MSRTVPWQIACSLIGLTALPMSMAHATDAATIAQQGNGKGAAPCMACHGSDGAGQQAAGNPRLAGLDANYLRKQLDDFANGTRNSPVMGATATALGDDEREAIAQYYSNLPVPSTQMPASAASTAGAELATRGRWSKQLPGCVQCHGPGGLGVGASFPPLAGQPAAYVESQLRAWQHGSRHNDPLQLMQHISAALSDQDIHDVAAWFATQPVNIAGAAP